MPLKTTSAPSTPTPGTRPESLDRWQTLLPAEVVAQIEAETMELDAAVRAIADVS